MTAWLDGGQIIFVVRAEKGNLPLKPEMCLCFKQVIYEFVIKT